MIRTSILFLICFLSATYAYGQIRVYDPQTGESVSADQIERSQPELAPRPQVNAKTQPVPLPPAPPSQISSRLGRVVIFIKPQDLDQNLANEIRDLYDLGNQLELQVIVQNDSPQAYLSMMNGAEGIIPPDLDFNVDVSGYQAISHNVKEYGAIIYYDPAGSRRKYDLNEFDKLDRHMERFMGKKNKKR